MKGYKSFYKDENGKLYCDGGKNRFYYEVGEIVEIKGELRLCKNGFHFCENISDLKNYYPVVPWIVMGEVEVLGEVITEDDKSCTNKLKLIRIISFNEYINIHKQEAIAYSKVIYCSDAISYSRVVAYSGAVCYSRVVACSEAIIESEAIVNSRAIIESRAINQSEAAINSRAIDHSGFIYCSDAIVNSRAIFDSEAIYCSEAIVKSRAINQSYGCLNCEGLYKAIFTLNKEGGNCLIFNKQVTEERFDEARRQLIYLLEGWLPSFYNINKLYMKFGENWRLVPFNDLKGLSKEEAWADMPIEAIKYVKSLKEFDADIFNKITGLK